MLAPQPEQEQGANPPVLLTAEASQARTEAGDPPVNLLCPFCLQVTISSTH